jgi:hypothetical protein
VVCTLAFRIVFVSGPGKVQYGYIFPICLYPPGIANMLCVCIFETPFVRIILVILSDIKMKMLARSVETD